MWPEWFRLVLHYSESVSYAPTIPFVVGALRNPVGSPINDEEKCVKELKDLLTSVIEEAPAGYFLQLHRCKQIHQPVLAPFVEAYHIPGNPVFSTTQNRQTLVMDDEFVDDEPSPAVSIAEILWDELGETILYGRFSFGK
jgi:hypothetical protein